MQRNQKILKILMVGNRVLQGLFLMWLTLDYFYHYDFARYVNLVCFMVISFPMLVEVALHARIKCEQEAAQSAEQGKSGSSESAEGRDANP